MQSFRKGLKAIMKIYDKIRDQKLQYDTSRGAHKIGKIDKYEYLTSEEILPFSQSQIIESVKFIYFPLIKAFEKQTKSTEDQETVQTFLIK